MNKLYNTTDIFHLYYVDVDDRYTKYKIKTFSKEWWRFIWDELNHIVNSYCNMDRLKYCWIIILCLLSAAYLFITGRSYD